MGTGGEVRGYRHLTRAKRIGRTLDCYAGRQKGRRGIMGKGGGEEKRRAIISLTGVSTMETRSEPYSLASAKSSINTRG